MKNGKVWDKNIFCKIENILEREREGDLCSPICDDGWSATICPQTVVWSVQSHHGFYCNNALTGHFNFTFPADIDFLTASTILIFIVNILIIFILMLNIDHLFPAGLFCWFTLESPISSQGQCWCWCVLMDSLPSLPCFRSEYFRKKYVYGCVRPGGGTRQICVM